MNKHHTLHDSKFGREEVWVWSPTKKKKINKPRVDYEPRSAHGRAAKKKLYCFPPFSCILQVLQKIIQDQATGVVVVPYWPTQAWYPLLTSLLFLLPVKLHPSKNLLRLPATPTTVHPLHKNTSLLICLLSSNNLQDYDLLNVLFLSYQCLLA